MHGININIDVFHCTSFCIARQIDFIFWKILFIPHSRTDQLIVFKHESVNYVYLFWLPLLIILVPGHIYWLNTTHSRNHYSQQHIPMLGNYQQEVIT